jgi:hypothetical protein
MTGFEETKRECEINEAIAPLIEHLYPHNKSIAKAFINILIVHGVKSINLHSALNSRRNTFVSGITTVVKFGRVRASCLKI